MRLLFAVLMLGAACSSSQASQPPTVEVRLHHSRFVPAAFEFEAGTTVRFVVSNGDPIDHEFLLGDGARQDAHETGTELVHGAIPGEVTVPAGLTRETTYTFPEPGVVLLGCHAPGHWNYGMRGIVLVR